MKWVLSDGTEVHLGGRVKGDSEVAEALRSDVLAVRQLYGVPVQYGLPPGGTANLDLTDSEVFDLWVKQVVLRFGAVLVDSPNLPDERPQVEMDDTPDAVF